MKIHVAFIATIVLLIATAATHHPKHRLAPPTALAPVLIGQVVLADGVGVVRHPSIHAGMIVIFSVNSPDSLSAGARVSVYQMDDGVLFFWSHTYDSQGSFPTADEPEVHFSVWNSAGPGVYP